ncbi:hypothetical protein DIPPA_08158 [Diplonema papillatum]|nr:hypothetical protein DIPPA_12218 [Diplonema papillatum]KAJ9437607.1 hypothetical protein DIPPA_02523 [Diplonema papillatum]KAJ9438158.1 hypothetical protein DIPPA_08256 [Diplonema papillatum]KAJ9439000.1 hypothetical protein DIPPA_01908 [Diplonema papillatum]KAJ9439120.1 hypothetical protein DIPPA_34321 [Diplonema papillatum]
MAMKTMVRHKVDRDCITGFWGVEDRSAFTKGTFLEDYEISFAVSKSELDTVLRASGDDGLFFSILEREECRTDYTDIMLGSSATLEEAEYYRTLMEDNCKGLVYCRGDYGIRVLKEYAEGATAVIFPHGKADVGYFLVEGVPSKATGSKLRGKLETAGWEVDPLFQQRRGQYTADWVVKAERHPGAHTYDRDGVSLTIKHILRPPLEQAKPKGGEPDRRTVRVKDAVAYPDPLSDSTERRTWAYFSRTYGVRAANAWRKAAEAEGAGTSDYVEDSPLSGGRPVGMEAPPDLPARAAHTTQPTTAAAAPSQQTDEDRVSGLERKVDGLMGEMRQMFGALHLQMQQPAEPTNHSQQTVLQQPNNANHMQAPPPPQPSQTGPFRREDAGASPAPQPDSAERIPTPPRRDPTNATRASATIDPHKDRDPAGQGVSGRERANFRGAGRGGGRGRGQPQQ